MAFAPDKKKKIIITKFQEPNSPRRPIILKSDREYSKEVRLEKPEREKSPTFVLKTREQSATKDESLNFNVHNNTEAEESQNYETPANEVVEREKRVIDVIQSQDGREMYESTKLLDENLVVNHSAIDFLSNLNMDYLIVGVIGTQGVGKSLILNLLAEEVLPDDICSKIYKHSTAIHTSVHGEENEHIYVDSGYNDVSNAKGFENDTFFKFKIQDADHIERGISCTKGIDMYVTKSRVILLDCQTFASCLNFENNSVPLHRNNGSYIVGLQLTSFMMSVCHVVIAVQDWFADYNLVRYIQTAEMLKPPLTVPLSHGSIQDDSELTTFENHPHVLILHNKASRTDFMPKTVKTMQTFYRETLRNSNMQIYSGMHLYNGICDKYELACKKIVTENNSKLVNLILLPEISDETDELGNLTHSHPNFNELATRLRRLVMSVNRHQVTSVPNLSERGWFQHTVRAWETVRKCSFFIEYERFLPS